MDIGWAFLPFLWAVVIAGTLVWAAVWSLTAVRASRRALLGIRKRIAWWRIAGRCLGALAAVAMLTITLGWFVLYTALGTQG